ncbi:MAG: T9SS type A sorting domain-containing protein [Bacteroidetes bacterium]|nr:T9SS type A sorting domain-containing protein [Bacteroidota bacterium]
MKKTLLSIVAILALSVGVNAQWIEQATGFATASRGIRCVYAVNDQVVWATAYDGTATGAACQDLTVTTNGGTLWTPHKVTGTTILDIANVVALDASTAWVSMYPPAATTTGQGIYKTTDGGVTWTRQTTAAFGTTSFVNVVYFWDANLGYCMGDPIGGEFEIYTTDNGGTTWTIVPGANIPNAIAGEYGTVGYYASIGDTTWFGTTKGRVFKSIDHGHNWTMSAITGWSALSTQPFARDKNNIICGDRSAATTGKMVRSVDGGTTWTPIVTTGNVFTNDMCYIPGTPKTWVTTGAATGLSGVTYSFDDAVTWKDMDVTIGTQFLGSDWVNDSTGWAGGFNADATTGGMFKFEGILAPCDFTANVVAVAMGDTVKFSIKDGAHSTSTVSWAFPGGSPTTSIKRNPAIKYNTAGSYNVTLTVTNTWGITTNLKANYVYVGGVGINEHSTASVSVFPNPVKDVLNLQGTSNIEEVTVMNMVGQVVLTQKADIANLTINTSGLASGVYNLRIKMADGFINKKIVVK